MITNFHFFIHTPRLPIITLYVHAFDCNPIDHGHHLVKKYLVLIMI